MKFSIKDIFKKLQDSTKRTDQERVSFYITDPVSGSVSLHGATNKRPKAYAGEVSSCPWDDFKNPIMKMGEAFLVPNDFPALNVDSLSYDSSNVKASELYDVSLARGKCFVVIYTHEHDKKWFELNQSQHVDVVKLWSELTIQAKKTKDIVFTHLFENIGPSNSMTHPHGQQYNLSDIPPKIKIELENSQKFYEKNKKNLFRAILAAELDVKERIVIENDSFIAFVPPGAEWPFQIRVLPKNHKLWIYEFDDKERRELAEIITKIRKGLDSFFSESFKPTIMMNLNQAPYDNDEFYRDIYSFRVEFYNTALSQNAEKLMFSIENSLGLKVYGDSCEDNAKVLREFIK